MYFYLTHNKNGENLTFYLKVKKNLTSTNHIIPQY